MNLNATTRRWCIYCGPLLMVFFMLGFWVIADLVPPPSPDDSASEVAEFYADNETRVRIGLIVSMFAAGLAFPFSVAIFTHMRTVEGPGGPGSFVQLTTGLLNGPLFILPMICLSAATFRADSRDQDVTEGLSDLGWIMFVGIPAPAMIQLIAIAVVVFRDHRPDPLYPRWVGYFNVWCALLFVPGPFIICFKTGPFAWDGVFTWWIPLTVFGGWFFVMAYVMLQVEKKWALEGGPPPLPQETRTA